MSFTARFLGTLLFFWVSAHIVYFGMTVNGAYRFGGPIWYVTSGLVNLEIALFKIVWYGILVAGVCALAWILYLLSSQILALFPLKEKESETTTDPIQRSADVPLENEINRPKQPQYEPLAPLPKPVQAPAPVPKPKPPSVNQVKAKAIEQLLRRF